MSKTYNFDNGFSVIAKPSKNDSYDVVVQYEGKDVEDEFLPTNCPSDDDLAGFLDYISSSYEEDCPEEIFETV